VAPPRSFSVEISETADGGELELFEGRHVPVAELNAAFKLKLRPSVVEISGQASVDNAWVALSFGLVNQNDEVCLETDGEASYYHGVEGGESWSEGSNSFSEYVRVDQPGTYRLLVFGASGSGETADAAGGPPVRIELREGAMLSRYFLAMFVLALLYPLKEFVRRRNHEKRRIPTEDDDDDD
jgi:hypothetical protein